MTPAAGDDHGDDDRSGEPVERVDYHRDGSIRARGQVVGGEPEGYWEWFRLDGTIMRSGTFEAGAQIGEWTTYDKSGAPYKTTRIKSR